MKRIALVATAVALPGEKGLARLHYLAEFFCKYGYDVDLITSNFQHWEKKFRDPKKIAEIKSDCRISLVEERGYTKNVQVSRIVSYRILANNIKKHLEQNEYDLVYCMIPDNHIAAVSAKYAKKHGIPFIIDVEDLWPEAMRMAFDVPVVSDILFSYFTVNAKKAYRLSDGVVGSSDDYRDEPLKYHIDIPKKTTVYVGNDIAAFDSGAQENISDVQKPENEFWITYAGTLGTSYDIATLIRAADLLEKQGEHNVRVMLLGDGPLRGEFETLAKSLSGKVSFLGYVPHAVMAAYLVKSDVVINSVVRKAPQSIVSKIGDYLASSRPMINTCINPEFWKKVEQDGFGVNVEPEDAEALAKTILALKNDPEGCEKMGQTARKIAEEQFDRPHSYRRIVDLADELLQVKR